LMEMIIVMSIPSVHQRLKDSDQVPEQATMLLFGMGLSGVGNMKID
jgi:hypothetical protein